MSRVFDRVDAHGAFPPAPSRFVNADARRQGGLSRFQGFRSPLHALRALLQLFDVALAALHPRAQIALGAKHAREIADGAGEVRDGRGRADLGFDDAARELVTEGVEPFVRRLLLVP